ncbi:TPA: hypothetical protein N0F65_006399 [Lagenidium giganteum]|uniref:Guanylate cyclase domain-containing protein n=1 Tax=Lagenidium giganteum TaxID=4803 RepID=A0AAV2YQM0_9STRA|nr:TPA: hypothetical protein N0F65_006399 [Lagenidium giganteum]
MPKRELDAQQKELTVLRRHVPRIVMSRFLRKPERLRGPEMSSFTAVVALFDISGFSSLGSKLQEVEKDKIKGLNLNTKDAKDTAAKRHRSSMPLLMSPNEDSSTGFTGSLGYGSDGGSTGEAEDRQENDHRDMMRQRRQSSRAQNIASVQPVRQRSVSFVSRAKPVAPQGIAVETLTTTLNKTLEPVIDVISRHNGDIIKFAGDAMIVLWETEESLGQETNPGVLTYSAVKCALEALEVLESVSRTESHMAILGMHIGIGVSTMTGNHVGGVLDRWEFYLSGDANRQMSSAESSASKGQVALSPEAYSALMDAKSLLKFRVTASPTSTGNHVISSITTAAYEPPVRPVLEPTFEMIQFMRYYVPGSITSSLQKDLALNPCVRNITAVFIKLEGILELDNGREQLEQIQSFLTVIQESAYKVQGTLRQFVIDDKGAVAVVAVGLPPFYHENNALRGVKLACYLLERGIPASIGVTSGNALCGSVGSETRAEYAVVGDVINLAARLMSAAQTGEILCDEHTRDDSKDSIQYQDYEEISVKGKSERVKVFRVQRDHVQTKLDASALVDTPFALPYGVEYVLDLVPLVGMRGDRKAQTNRVLIISGESGTGKTMLLRHYLYHNTRCFMGQGDSVDSALEFHAWSGIVREMASRTIKTSRGQAPSDRTNTTRAEEDFIASVMSESQQAVIANESEVRKELSRRYLEHRGFASHQQDSNVSSASSGRSATTQGSSDQLSRGPSGNRIVTGAGTYERVPVLEYLVRQRRVADSVIPLLNDLLPHDHMFRTDFNALEEGEERTKALEYLIFSIVEAISEYKPILLMFDSAQWMDSHSWGLLLKVLEELPNVHALIATRTQNRLKSQPIFDVIERLPYVQRQDMRRFSYQITSLFLSQQYHIAIMDSQLLDFVYARTEGNPAELVKLMSFMIESRYIMIDRSNGHVSILSDLDDLDMQVPQYTRARVMSCVDMLDGLAQIALKVLSINPEPLEERVLNGVLTLIFSAEASSSTDMASTVRLKVQRSNSTLSIFTQARAGLQECEKEAIITIDNENHVIFFNSDEMRLVVYDTMLPSQREMIHGLYAKWLETMTKPIASSSLIRSSILSSGRFSDAAATATSVFHRFAMLGYHLSRSGNARSALDAYQKAAEHAIEAKDLPFATDCMQSAFKIVDDNPRGSKLNELEYILLRGKIEFMRGAIAVEKSEWDIAIAHLGYIIRLCQRKGSVLRRYSSSIFHEGLTDAAMTTRKLTVAGPSFRKPGGIDPAPVMPEPSTTDVSSASFSSRLRWGVSGDSLWYLELQQRCMPGLLGFRIFRSPILVALFLGKPRNTRRSQNKMRRLHMGVVQPEETLALLNQVLYFRKKAELLIRKIEMSKKKQEEMSREIQKLTQKSLQTKHKR